MKPQKSLLRILVLEDDSDVFAGYLREASLPVVEGETSFALEWVKTVDDAAKALVEQNFDGIMVDLRLSGTADGAEGNEIAKKVYQSLFIPMAIVSAFSDELASELQDLNDKENALFAVFNKSTPPSKIFDFFKNTRSSEALTLFGPDGELNKQFASIFWNHIGPAAKRWQKNGKAPEIRHRLLRHMAMHLVGALQANENEWDDYEPDEVYIIPPIRTFSTTGDIFRAHDGTGYFFLITPACDLVKSDQDTDAGCHLLKISPPNILKKSRLQAVVNKTNLRYHALPVTDQFCGGLIDFWSIRTVKKEDVADKYDHICTVIEPFSKDIAARFGGAFSRQGSPNLNETEVVTALFDAGVKITEGQKAEAPVS